MPPTSLIFQAILFSVLLTLVLALISIRTARRLHLIDLPNSAPHKRHNRPTPLAGGLALLSSLLLGSWVFGTWGNLDVQATFLAGSILFAFGLWDDYSHIPPVAKLAGQLLAGAALISLGVHIRIFESPEFFIPVSGIWAIYLDWLITLLWIAGISNAFNFVDSMDGLAVGLAGMAAAFFVLVTLDSGQVLLSIHSALVIGACAALYFFNSPPARLFLGDAGAQFLGFTLAVLAISYRPVGFNQSSSWLVPILLLGVPIFDAALVVFSRLRRRQPVYSASRDHTYHRLLALGLEPFRAVLVMQGTALLLACLAFILLSLPPLPANLIFALIVLIYAGALLYLDGRRTRTAVFGPEQDIHPDAGLPQER